MVVCFFLYWLVFFVAVFSSSIGLQSTRDDHIVLFHSVS